ncbi:MAG: methylmalonyl-CoA mutase family protein [Psychroflexus sp.]|nr:methylmalonyl-CoA mutase family protein [Psychroflexus sp.]MDR9449179.1 methylmalonyl-CoA mutase family protein [Psychroflexus sp.]
MSQHLFKDFDDVSANAWKQKIQMDLKGKDYNSLITKTAENIAIKPFYHQEDLSQKTAAQSYNDWLIVQEFDLDSEHLNHDLILQSVDKGTQKIVLKLKSSLSDNQWQTLKKLADKNVDVLLEVYTGNKTFNEIVAQVKSLKNLKLVNDPIHFLVLKGYYPEHSKTTEDIIKTQVSHQNRLLINASLYHNAGANATQEIAYTAAHLNEYLNLLADKKQLTALKEIKCKVAVGSRYFIEIAKLQALRILLESLLSKYEIKPFIRIQSINAHRNKTIYDYNLNMIRSTAESMAGILGGAEEINNLPYDFLFHHPNDFGQRIARNQLLMLREESHLDKVKNPTEGSYLFNSITHQLAEASLELLKSIEKSGGFLKQLKEGKIQQKIKEKAQQEQAKFDDKEMTLVGLNKYVDENGHVKDQLDFYPFVTPRHEKTQIEPIIAKRLAEATEKEWLEGENQKS